MYEKIIILFPELKDKYLPDLGIWLQNDADGKGDYIAKWEHPTLPKPTEAQLKD